MHSWLILSQLSWAETAAEGNALKLKCVSFFNLSCTCYKSTAVCWTESTGCLQLPQRMFIHFSTCHFLHLTSDFEDSTPPQSMWLRSGPFQLIWHWTMPRWHTCGQSSHQKPKQLSGRSSYSYSSPDSCRLFGVEMVWPVFSHKLPWSAWAEAPEAKRISGMLLRRGQFVLSLGGSRTFPRLLRRGQQWDKGLWKTHT